MKKIIYTIAFFTLITLTFSCTKELEFGSNFNFIIKEVDTNPYLKDSYKDVQIELTDLFGKETPTYSISIKKIEGTATITVDAFELMETDFYPINFVENKAIIKIKPTSFGLIKFTLLLKDSNGLLKEKIMQISTNTFDFTATSTSTSTPIFATNTAVIDMNIINTGNPVGNTYQIKYTSNQLGVFKIGNTTLTGDTYTSISSGQTLGNYTSSVVGQHNVSLTVKNAQGIEKNVIIVFNFLPSVAVISFPITPIEVKETIVKSFQISRTNLISAYTYQMKFTTDKMCVIYDALDNPVPLDTYVTIPSTDGTFVYKYLAKQGTNANLTVSIKNQLNTVIDKILPINVNPSPIVTDIKAEEDATSGVGDLYFWFNGVALGSGETIAEYELKVYKNNGTLIGTYNTAYTRIPAQTGQPWSYQARVKDSSGRWSTTISGQFIDYP